LHDVVGQEEEPLMAWSGDPVMDTTSRSARLLLAGGLAVLLVPLWIGIVYRVEPAGIGAAEVVGFGLVLLAARTAVRHASNARITSVVAPEQCPNCGAPVTRTVVNGQSTWDCTERCYVVDEVAFRSALDRWQASA
jgi:endogenous inhibitor of DNA gyrase (YacG/DUF329 family)